MTSSDPPLAGPVNRQPDREVYRLSRPPDGRIMCCICFYYMQPDECWVDADGQGWDLHPACVGQARGVPKE